MVFLKPKVSIVSSTYNCGAFIEETIRSVIHQTFDNWELILVDDCSEDNTFEKIRMFQDRRIKSIMLDRHCGLPAVVRNKGIEMAGGIYIAFLDGDDVWCPDKLFAQVKVMEENPLIGLSYGITRFMHNGLIANKMFHRLNSRTAELLRFTISVPVSSVVVRKSILSEVGNFMEDPSYKAVEDTELWLRIAKAGHKLRFIPRTLYFYRVHPGSITFTREYRSKIEKVFNKKIPLKYQLLRLFIFIPYKIIDLLFFKLFSWHRFYPGRPGRRK